MPAPHPFLHEPKLYMSGLSPDVTVTDIAQALETCLPLRPRIFQTSAIGPYDGEIDFKYLESAEKALATLQSHQLEPASLYTVLVLSPFPKSEPQRVLSPPSAQLRLVKQLPPDTTDSYLFDLFRPYGALASVRTQSSFGPDIGVVEFWEEEDAKAAETALHCADVGGSNISVQPYQPRRSGPGRMDFNAAAPPFVPSGAIPSSTYSPASHNTRLSPLSQHQYPYPASPTTNTPLPPFHHGPGQQVQFAPLMGPGSSSHSGLIDPCNLFCKNIDSGIDSNDLFNYFKMFGHIVSARVMRGENGQSRGFGFVSFQSSDQASHAMQSMDGQMLRGKQIQVRLHEPKLLRQEKLAQRYSTTGASGSTSPATSENEHHPPMSERTRRGSGSHYTAPQSGSLNLSWDVDELQSLTPAARKEVLTAELNRRVRALQPKVPVELVDDLVNRLLSLPLTQLAQAIREPESFAAHIRQLTEELECSDGPNCIESATELLSLSMKPLSVSGAGLATEPSGFSPGTSTPTSERDRMVASIARLEIDAGTQDGIIDLLMTLSKRERAMCLFNQDYLKTKVQEARGVLDADTEPEEVFSSNKSAPATSGRPSASPVPNADFKAASEPTLGSAPDSLTGFMASDRAAHVPEQVAEPSVPQYTLASLALLPAKEIVQLAATTVEPLQGLPLPKADPVVIKATDDFVDSLQSKPIQQQKQLLGEKLFRVIRAFGIKGSPKFTITLLDSEDLRALSHLMNSYPDVLRAKVLLLVGKS